MTTARLLIAESHPAAAPAFAAMLASNGFLIDTQPLGEIAETAQPPLYQGVVIVLADQEGVTFDDCRLCVAKIRHCWQAHAPFIVGIGETAAAADLLMSLGLDDVIHGFDTASQLSRRLAGLSRVGVMRRELARRHITDARFRDDTPGLDALEFAVGEDASSYDRHHMLVVALDPSTSSQVITLADRTGRYAVAKSQQEAREMLYAQPYDICLIATGRNHLAAQEMLSSLRNSPSLFSLPVIVLHEAGGRFNERALYEQGANDVATVPADAPGLSARIDFAVRIERLRRSMAMGLRHKAPGLVLDSLTGLYTHSYILAHLAQVASDMRSAFGQVPVATITISDLGRINEALGFDIGDQVLRKVAGMIGRCLRLEDVAGRLRGSTFLMLFPESTLAQAQVAMNRLGAVLNNSTISLANGDTLAVRVASTLYDWSCDRPIGDALSLGRTLPTGQSRNAA